MPRLSHVWQPDASQSALSVLRAVWHHYTARKHKLLLNTGQHKRPLQSSLPSTVLSSHMTVFIFKAKGLSSTLQCQKRGQMTLLGRRGRKGLSSCGEGQKESTSSDFLEAARREKSWLFCNLQELSPLLCTLVSQWFNEQQVTWGSCSSGSPALRQGTALTEHVMDQI